METERKVFNQNELTPEELGNVVDITNYLLSSIDQEETFLEAFDPSKPSQVVEYREKKDRIPLDYREENIEEFEKHDIGNIFLDTERGLVVEAIKFFREEDKDPERILIPIEEVCKNLGLINAEILNSPNYQNFLRAVEYLQKEIVSKESLRRFLDNPGIHFKYSKDRRIPQRKGGNSFRVSFHEKNIYIPKEEKGSVEGWKYVKTFENFRGMLNWNPEFVAESMSRIVGNYLNNEDIGDYKGIFTHLRYGDASVIMIVTKVTEED
jgi:hypothetical protein